MTIKNTIYPFIHTEAIGQHRQTVRLFYKRSVFLTNINQQSDTNNFSSDGLSLRPCYTET